MAYFLVFYLAYSSISSEVLVFYRDRYPLGSQARKKPDQLDLINLPSPGGDQRCCLWTNHNKPKKHTTNNHHIELRVILNLFIAGAHHPFSQDIAPCILAASVLQPAIWLLPVPSGNPLLCVYVQMIPGYTCTACTFALRMVRWIMLDDVFTVGWPQPEKLWKQPRPSRYEKEGRGWDAHWD